MLGGPSTTVNRLCGPSLDADLMMAGGVEGMSRAPLVMP
jgi:acetyl-CoA acetyltransferase